ncbi:hypothetical protein CROQUDRAFT_93026 [Cronartium quercuum f. sp. fusiforme G11]|uniref:Uncharacterized protein n=1 Tax=Cronartium quercuum f. sp. fusiforme G11 TaxID=708437 RepID=A0A9P6TBC6_9BASI|nr:hypothetical protein CROQUDRAFT_93026 [Cronartium quercuum f. sp. fusiforme G11]
MPNSLRPGSPSSSFFDGDSHRTGCASEAREERVETYLTALTNHTTNTHTADKAFVEHFFEKCVIQTRFGQFNPEWPKLILVPAIFNSRIPVSQQQSSLENGRTKMAKAIPRNP